MDAFASAICSSARLTLSFAAGCASAPTSRALRAADSASAIGCLGSGHDFAHAHARGMAARIRMERFNMLRSLSFGFLFEVSRRTSAAWTRIGVDRWVSERAKDAARRLRAAKFA